MERVYDLKDSQFSHFIKSYSLDCTKTDNVVFLEKKTVTDHKSIKGFKFEYYIGESYDSSEFESDQFKVGVVIHGHDARQCFTPMGYKNHGYAHTSFFIGLDPDGVSISYGESWPYKKDYVKGPHWSGNPSKFEEMLASLKQKDTHVVFTIKDGYSVIIEINGERLIVLDARTWISAGFNHHIGFIKFECPGRAGILTTNKPIHDEKIDVYSRRLYSIKRHKNFYIIRNDMVKK